MVNFSVRPSQGAHIIGDAVAGGGGVSGLGAATPPVAASISDKGSCFFSDFPIFLTRPTVVAIAQMGDGVVPIQPFNILGTSKRAGLIPRQSNQQYSATLQPRIQSWCDAGDPFYDSGTIVSVQTSESTSPGIRLLPSISSVSKLVDEGFSPISQCSATARDSMSFFQ